MQGILITRYSNLDEYQNSSQSTMILHLTVDREIACIHEIFLRREITLN